ncbi:MAG: hypothetical protein HY434_00485 [Candidatus Liptonbacteria bacterium]|nr:hypothetical protein [Candidatus Liptonbacteria bacterium]
MRRIRVFVVGLLFVVGALAAAPPAEAATVHGTVVRAVSAGSGAARSGAKWVAKGVAKTPGWSWNGVKWLARHA